MKTYKIPVSWCVTADMEVEAENIEEAIKKAEEESLPTDSFYLDDSFRVDVDFFDDDLEKEYQEYLDDKELKKGRKKGKK